MNGPRSDRLVVRSGAAFELDGWIVEPAVNRLCRGGAVVHLRPKVMDVLVVLAERAGEVLSKNEIVDAVWAKEFLADTALTRAVFELREALADDPQNPRYVETIPKRGYRLIAPVSRVGATAEDAGSAPRPARRLLGRPSVFGGTCLMALLLSFLGAVGRSGHQSAAAAPAPSKRIVVLPFENLGSPGDSFLASGLAEEIKTRLFSVSGIAVISRGSVERLASSGRSEKEIGKALAADYVLAGAIRWDRSGTRLDRVRITPKLVRVSDGAEVWAGAYDGTLQDILRVQGDVATNVIAELGIRLTGSDRKRVSRPPTTNDAALEAFLRGLYHGDNLYKPESELRLGLQMYERAVQLDPGFALAWASLSQLRSGLYHMGYDRSESCCAEAKAAADRAVELDPGSSEAHASLGFHYYWCQREWQRALDEFAIAGRSGGERAWFTEAEGYVLRRLGRWDEARASFASSAALDPMAPSGYREWGLTSLSTRRFGEAEEQFKRAIGLAPDEPSAYGFLAQTFWLRDGDTERARLTLQAIPRPSDPWLSYWWFWQELFERKLEAALERALAFDTGVVTNNVLTNGLTWDSRDLMLGRAYSLLGRRTEALQAFGAARSELEGLLRARPGEFALHSALGIALAGLGRRDEAIRAGRRAVELMPLSGDAVDGTGPLLALAEILATSGQAEEACRQLQTLISVPAGISAPVLRIDPRWAPLRGRPCFAALLARNDGSQRSPVDSASTSASGRPDVTPTGTASRVTR